MTSILKKIIRNKYFYCFLFLIVLMFPTTIYRQSDNNSKLVITSLGIDSSDEGYEITSLAVIPNSSDDINANLETFTGKGTTISSALEEIAKNTGKKIGLAHCDCIVISSSLTDSNITKILDYFIRTANLTSNSSLAITEEKAKDVIEASKTSNNLLNLTLKDIITFQETSSLLNSTTIQAFYRAHFSKSGTFFLPVLTTEDGSESPNTSDSSSSGGASSSSGSSSSDSSNGSTQKKIKNKNKIAVLKDGKFKRFLTEDEKFIYDLLSPSNKIFTLQIDDVNDEYVTNSIEIYQQVSKVSLPIYKFYDGKPTVTYEVWISFMMDEISSDNNFSFASIDSLQNFMSKNVESKIKEKIENKLKITNETMKENQDDILDLYQKFNAFTHRQWQEYLSSLDNPDDYLSGVEIRINPHLNYVI